jgi:hypothetical protein
VLGVAVGLQVVGLSEAAACTFFEPLRFAVDTNKQPEDPAAAAMSSVQVDIDMIWRGHSPDTLSSQCPEIGGVAVFMGPLSEKVGYELEVVDGELPAGLVLPTVPVMPIGVASAIDEAGDQFAKNPDQKSDFSLIWDDGATDEQEPFDFELVVTPIDQSGQRGVRSEPIRVSHPGTHSSGPQSSQAACSTSSQQQAGNGSGALFSAILGCLLLIFRRRRNIL